jgi:hypothetical protein
LTQLAHEEEEAIPQRLDNRLVQLTELLQQGPVGKPVLQHQQRHAKVYNQITMQHVQQQPLGRS